MTKGLIPQSFWFRMAAPCPRVDEMPRPGDSQRLLDLHASCALPNADRANTTRPIDSVRADELSFSCTFARAAQDPPSYQITA